jgi:hypothetical protein
MGADRRGPRERDDLGAPVEADVEGFDRPALRGTGSSSRPTAQVRVRQRSFGFLFFLERRFFAMVPAYRCPSEPTRGPPVWLVSPVESRRDRADGQEHR